MNASEQFERIEIKVRQLLALVKQLRRDNGGLQEENRELKTHIAQRDAAIRVLQTQMERAEQELVKLRREETEQSDKFKEQIDQYVKEIDKRIELLANN
jgi:chromosome segregation ATPase